MVHPSPAFWWTPLHSFTNFPFFTLSSMSLTEPLHPSSVMILYLSAYSSPTFFALKTSSTLSPSFRMSPCIRLWMVVMTTGVFISNPILGYSSNVFISTMLPWGTPFWESLCSFLLGISSFFLISSSSIRGRSGWAMSGVCWLFAASLLMRSSSLISWVIISTSTF